VLQSVLLTDGPEGKNCVRTTSYYAFMLFKAHRAKTAVRVETDGPKLSDYGAPPARGGGGGRGAQPPQDPLPDLSLSASRLGSEMVLTLVNPRQNLDMDVECALRGVTARSGRAQILHDSDINAYNGFDNPNRVTIKPHEVAVEGGRVRITLPSMSVATVTLQV
jgi:alpha-N-arabinofuranosidase